jgi:hypothetical protein
VDLAGQVYTFDIFLKKIFSKNDTLKIKAKFLDTKPKFLFVFDLKTLLKYHGNFNNLIYNLETPFNHCKT